MISDFREDRAVAIIQVVIIEIGLLFGLLSLISTQRKLIERYNESEDNNSDKTVESPEQKQEIETNKKTE